MKKRLGEMLIKAKEITEEQLNEALGIQKKNDEMLGVVLINLGYLDDETLINFLRMQGTIVKMHIGKEKIYNNTWKA